MKRKAGFWILMIASCWLGWLGHHRWDLHQPFGLTIVITSLVSLTAAVYLIKANCFACNVIGGVLAYSAHVAAILPAETFPGFLVIGAVALLLSWLSYLILAQSHRSQFQKTASSPG